jgi:hypothetical protein
MRWSVAILPDTAILALSATGCSFVLDLTAKGAKLPPGHDPSG